MGGRQSTSSSSGPGWTAFLLAQLGGFAAMRFAERLTALRVTPPQAGLLRAIGADPGRSQQAVADQLGLLPSRLVALLDELESAGLVQRRRNPADRRLYALHLTPAGQDRLREVGRVAQLHGEDVLRPLGPDDRQCLAGLLGRLAAHHGLAPGVHPGFRAMNRGGPMPGPARAPACPSPPPGSSNDLRSPCATREER